MDARQTALQQWLTHQFPQPNFRIHPLAGDASFRRYFRIQQNGKTWIAMDAPPDRENCIPFVAIAQALKKMGLNTPDIVASHIDQGFLLLSDLGDDLYIKKLNDANAEKLYDIALQSLSLLSTCRDVANWRVPFFTAEFIRQELELFKEWFLVRYLNYSLSVKKEKELNDFFDELVKSIAAQPVVFMHRDFHSANLMLLPNEQVGILDFQDAFMGPVTYDLVSLLRDSYIAWPDDLVKKLALSYREKIEILSTSEEEFLYWFDMMSLQRHLKALLTFSRKYCRDHNSNYLQHIPRTLNYLRNVSIHYPQARILHEVMSTCER